MKKIVILGAGFGGIACAKALLKHKPNAQISIIDQSSDHIVHGNLYEVATSPEELTSLTELKRSVAVPIKEIFAGQPVEIIRARVDEVDLAKKTIRLGDKNLSYDVLVSSLGAGPNFFAIPGASENALTMLTAIDALKIRSRIETAIQTHKYDNRKPAINIIVAGGGVGGVELAAELQTMIDFLTWQNNYSRQKVMTTVVERAETVLNGFPQRVVEAGTERLRELGIKLQTNSTIKQVESANLVTDQGSFPFDVLIWTAGVSANSLPGPIQTPVSVGKRIEVNDQFQLNEFRSVYIIGDQCCRHDEQGNPMPGTASQAINHAEFVASSILATLKNQKHKNHSCLMFPFIIPMGGKWAIYSSNRLFFEGYFGYLVRQLVWLRYFASILGWWRGAHWWIRSSELYSRND